ncbi:hypothetical protein BS78_03G281400 [Paspalum vaginatum]|nr:hypothetical protein BS78_03G281400 [Paspalum vaginatum]
MFCLRSYWSPAFALLKEGAIQHHIQFNCVVVCCARGPRPRYSRMWKTRKKIGTISKSQKLVECARKKFMAALDSFVAWDLEFPLIVVKKALKTLENGKEWKRIIQVIKWMFNKGQGKTMGSYYTFVRAYDKMFEIFADTEELGHRPDSSIVRMLGDVFLKLEMVGKYEKLKKKYQPPKSEYRYIKGKRIRMRVYPDNGLEEAGSAHPDNELEEAASLGLDRNVLDDAASGDLEYV